MFKKIIILMVLMTAVSSFCLSALTVQAQTTSIIDPTDAKYEEGTYELNDFVILAIKVSRWILGIVGSLSLIMFIYGGIMFLISAGSSDTIGKARKIIIAAVVGLIIVFASWLIIKFVMQSMGLNWEGTVTKPQIIPEQIAN